MIVETMSDKITTFGDDDARPSVGILVDASCFKATYEPYFYGRVEWQGVDLSTGKTILKSALHPRGTINAAEYLAIADALYYLHQRGDSHTPVYSDSRNGIAWARNRRTNCKMPNDEHTRNFLALLASVTEWMNEAKPKNPVRWWDEKAMGANTADFGRKGSKRK